MIKDISFKKYFIQALSVGFAFASGFTGNAVTCYCIYLLMSSGRLLWSERETGDTGVAVAEMASPGPWEEAHSLNLFTTKAVECR